MTFAKPVGTAVTIDTTEAAFLPSSRCARS